MIPEFVLENNFNMFEDTIKQIGGRVQHIPSGTVLYKATHVPRMSYYIRDGIAKLGFTNEQGLEQLLVLFGQGSMYPTNRFDSLQNIEKYLHLTAITDLDVITFPAKNITKLIMDNPEFSIHLMDYYNNYIHPLFCRCLLSSYRSSLISVSSFLYLYKSNKTQPNLTQENISQLLGISRMHVTRALTTLRNENIITTKRNYIEIIDIDRLKEYCSNIILTDDDFI